MSYPVLEAMLADDAYDLAPDHTLAFGSVTAEYFDEGEERFHFRLSLGDEVLDLEIDGRSRDVYARNGPYEAEEDDLLDCLESLLLEFPSVASGLEQLPPTHPLSYTRQAILPFLRRYSPM